MHFGPTEKEEIDQMAEELRELKKVANNTATLQGCSIEVQILKQQIVKQQTQIDSLTGLIMTLQGQFRQYEQQRAIELSAALNGGPTVIE